MSGQNAIDDYLANEVEYRALIDAEEGNPLPLADFIRTVGALQTEAAREFVAARVLGEKKQRGQKRTVAQQVRELYILDLIRKIQVQMNCGEHTARNVFLDRYPGICSNEESLRTYIRRAKKFWKDSFGREPSRVVQKRDFSEPE